MKTQLALVLAGAATVMLAVPYSVAAGEPSHAQWCRAAVERRSDSGKLALWYATFPFRALWWAFYHTNRAPGQLAEYLAFGQTGEQVASPVAVTPASPWKRVPQE